MVAIISLSQRSGSDLLPRAEKGESIWYQREILVQSGDAAIQGMI